VPWCLLARWPESRAGVPELRRNGRYVGASLGCEALRRVLWGVRWPHCLDARRRGALQAYLGENPRAIVRWRQTATRAILQPYQLFPDCIIATLGRDFREGQAHYMSFCRFFYTSWPDVVPARPIVKLPLSFA
jgi:hypothetical protein